MSDLTDDEILGIERSLGGPELVATSKSETCRMVAELTRRRAEQRAGQGHVREVVMKILDEQFGRDDVDFEWSTAEMQADIATLVAERMIPVLGDPDRAALNYLLGWANASIGDIAVERERFEAGVAALDRLLASCPGKPTP